MSKPLCVECYTERTTHGYLQNKNIELLLHGHKPTEEKCTDCGEMRIVWGWMREKVR